MNVLVYVEGPSDQAALQALLKPVIDEGQRRRVGIRFLVLKDKASILNDSARKAADHILDHPGDWVFTLPDLYPLSVYDGTPNAHRSFPELEALLTKKFCARAQRIGLPREKYSRFRIHCLKHDLEALLLAAPIQLRHRLGTSDGLRDMWQKAVEDQNDDRPPKRVVEDLFNKYRKKRYVDTCDAPCIPRQACLDEVVAACPQRFAPFVSDLRILAGGGSL